MVDVTWLVMARAELTAILGASRAVTAILHGFVTRGYEGV
jgi:hypothetical protein